jgi:hypothetical protein
MLENQAVRVISFAFTPDQSKIRLNITIHYLIKLSLIRFVYSRTAVGREPPVAMMSTGSAGHVIVTYLRAAAE